MRGPLARGLTFERQVERHLAALQARASAPFEFLRGPWIEYEDANGYGYAQPDFVILSPPLSPQIRSWALVLEAKYTHVQAATEELNRLYAPLVQDLFQPLRLYRLEVFHNCAGPLERAVDGPLSVLEQPQGPVYCWHLLH